MPVAIDARCFGPLKKSAKIMGCLALVFTSVTSAQSPRVDRIEIVEKGIYQAATIKRIENKRLASGTMQSVASIKKVADSTAVPARLGVRFGFRFRLLGEPNGVAVPLSLRLKFPNGGLRNPETGAIHDYDELSSSRTIGDIHYHGYSFDHQWELVAGIWTFEIWYDDTKMLEQSFMVAKE